MGNSLWYEFHEHGSVKNISLSLINHVGFACFSKRWLWLLRKWSWLCYIVGPNCRNCFGHLFSTFANHHLDAWQTFFASNWSLDFKSFTKSVQVLGWIPMIPILTFFASHWSFDFKRFTESSQSVLSKNSTLISRENCRSFCVKNSWKCCGFGLFSWQLWFHEKNCQKKRIGWKTRENVGVLSKLNFWTKIWLLE